MRTLVVGPPCSLLERPVFDAHGHLLGRIAAIGTRHGEIRRIGIEMSAVEPAPLHFVSCDRFTVERDRIVLAP